MYGQEVVFRCADPTALFSIKPASWNHAVDMGVKIQLLVPGMQKGNKADAGAEVVGIGSHRALECDRK